jgi:predicted RNA-binding protein YlqC (UPF0109 family)
MPQVDRQEDQDTRKTVRKDVPDMADKLFDQEFVEYIVRAIVNHPDDVRTERIVDERGVLITLHINQEDMGYVIGRQGQTARAVRTLLKIVGAKENARVNLKIYEPEGSRRPRREDSDRPERNDRPAYSDRGATDSFSGSSDSSVDDLGI